MDDFNQDIDQTEAIDDVAEDSKRRVPVQMTVVEAVEILDNFKQKMIDESYDQMLEDGEADVRVPMEIVDALEVIVHFTNTSFELDEEF